MSSNQKPFMNKKKTSNADCLQRLVRPRYPSNRTELNVELAKAARRKWCKRAILWPLIIAGGFACDIIVINALQLTEQSARLMVGFVIGTLAASMLRAVA
jgi:hypothetical protein